MRNLEQIRQEINDIDTQLLELFKQRMDCAKEVGEYKKANDIPVLNQQREDEILDSVAVKGGEYGPSARLLYSNIMELSRALQHNIVGSGKELKKLIGNAASTIPKTNITVACQGIKGANTHEAATKFFPNATPKFFGSWSQVFASIYKGECDFGVLPVENSTAGSVEGVYDLLLKHRAYIVGAIDLQIDNNLCAIKQSEFGDIEQVWSHPQALSQCSDFITENHLKEVTSTNTAVAAYDISREKRLNCAAICSRRAAQEYGLKVIKENISDYDNNTTRFIVISKKLYITDGADKISLCFSLPHVSGSLYSVLCRFNSLGLNLTKIESRPIQGGDKFEYLFYLDFTGNVHSKNAIDLICQLSEEMSEFSFLGNYSEI